MMCSPAPEFIMTTKRPMNWMLVTDMTLLTGLSCDLQAVHPHTPGSRPAPRWRDARGEDPSRARARPELCATPSGARRRCEARCAFAETEAPPHRRRLPTTFLRHCVHLQ